MNYGFQSLACAKRINILKLINQFFVLHFYRLSYHQRIKDMMPASYEKLIPEITAPIYKYAAEGAGM